MIIVDDYSILDKCTVNGRISKKLCEKLIIPQIEKLQEQNKIFKEALEKISTDTVEVGFYVEPTWSAQIAREALAKVRDR